MRCSKATCAEARVGEGLKRSRREEGGGQGRNGEAGGGLCDLYSGGRAREINLC